MERREGEGGHDGRTDKGREGKGERKVEREGREGGVKGGLLASFSTCVIMRARGREGEKGEGRGREVMGGQID